MKSSWMVLGLFLAACGAAVPTSSGDASTGPGADGSASDATGATDPTDPTDATDPSDPSNPSSTTRPGTTTSPTDPSTTGSASESSSEESTSGTTNMFIDPTSGGCDALPDGTLAHCTLECDLLMQDCPRGEACKPWANDGTGQWNATICSPLPVSPRPEGDPCTVENNAASGFDNCEEGAMCWNVDPNTLEGTCVSLCQGEYPTPICQNPATSCVLANDFALPLCLETCHPFNGDCPEGTACYAVDGHNMNCLPLGAPVFVDDLPHTQCPSGTYAVPEDLLPECEEQPCCASYCEMDSPSCPEGLTCVPFSEEGSCPGTCPNADVGGCILPP